MRTEFEDSEIMSMLRIFVGAPGRKAGLLREIFYHMISRFQYFADVTASLGDMNDQTRSVYAKIQKMRRSQASVDIDKLQLLSDSEVIEKFKSMDFASTTVSYLTHRGDASGNSRGGKVGRTRERLRLKQQANELKQFLLAQTPAIGDDKTAAAAIDEFVVVDRAAAQLELGELIVDYLGHLWPSNECLVLSRFIKHHWLEENYEDQIAMLVLRLLAPRTHSTLLVKFFNRHPKMATEQAIDAAYNAFITDVSPATQQEMKQWKLGRIAFRDDKLKSTAQFAASLPNPIMFNPRTVLVRMAAIAAAGDFATDRLNDYSTSLLEQIQLARELEEIDIDAVQLMME
jgi:hypothetical protein